MLPTQEGQLGDAWSYPDFVELGERVDALELAGWTVQQGSLRIDEANCISFFEGIRTGELLEANDPVSVMRNHLIRSGIALGGRSRQRPSKTEQLAELAWVWNKWRQGEPIRAIRIPKNLTSATYPVLI